MDARTTVEQDDAMLQLLADAAPVPLGIPSWILKEMTTRVEFPVPPAEVLGLDGKEVSAEMLTEYKDKAGYQFSWGTVSESVSEVTGEEGTALCGAFAAVDALSGKTLWIFRANDNWRAAPMTYTIQGRQYVAVAAGGEGGQCGQVVGTHARIGSAQGLNAVSLSAPLRGCQPRP